jgi:hypothetical protein
VVFKDDTAVLPPILATAVGSMPHTDVAEAVDLILESLPRAPHPPQLSRVDPREQMWIQFTEGLPRFRLDPKESSYYFDTTGDLGPEVEEFCSAYIEVTEGGPAEKFGIGPDYGRGIHLLLDRLRGDSKKRPFIKVQVTGPLSFALGLTDETKKPIFYHPILKDVVVKGMGLKAVWLLQQFSPFAEKVIVFFDEPSLSAYGSSAFLGVSKSDVVEALAEVFSMVTERGGIPGVHCCGNTDWGMLMDASPRIINFDAVEYLETMAIYARDLADFVARGGVIAWGAVRNSEKVELETAQDVVGRVRAGLQLLEKAGVDGALLKSHLILTPACGCAGMTAAQTAKAYRILSELDALDPAGLFYSDSRK